jgi:hypothetical protein
MQEAGYAVHACAILPDHLHLVIGWHPRPIRTIVGHLRSKATKALRDATLWSDLPLWGQHGWNVRLESIEAVERAIAYTEDHPEKEGKPRQRWQLVTPFVARDVVAAQFEWERSAPLHKPQKIGGAPRTVAKLGWHANNNWSRNCAANALRNSTLSRSLATRSTFHSNQRRVYPGVDLEL